MPIFASFVCVYKHRHTAWNPTCFVLPCLVVTTALFMFKLVRICSTPQLGARHWLRGMACTILEQHASALLQSYGSIKPGKKEDKEEEQTTWLALASAASVMARCSCLKIWMCEEVLPSHDFALVALHEQCAEQLQRVATLEEQAKEARQHQLKGTAGAALESAREDGVSVADAPSCVSALGQAVDNAFQALSLSPCHGEHDHTLQSHATYHVTLATTKRSDMQFYVMS
eukprot:m.193958 g.193958  ORF g.193958 m.193958 type:complete len:229 (+) comp14886_c0_seq16:1286-1972(+)